MLLFSFFTCETEFVLFSAVLEFCIAHGLRQLTQDTISGLDGLQTILKRCNEKTQTMFRVGQHTTSMVDSF